MIVVLNWFQSPDNNNDWITDIPILHFMIFHPHSIVDFSSFIHSFIYPSKHLHQTKHTQKKKRTLKVNINVWSMVVSTYLHIIALQSLTKSLMISWNKKFFFFTISFKFVALLLQLLSVSFLWMSPISSEYKQMSIK